MGTTLATHPPPGSILEARVDLEHQACGLMWDLEAFLKLLSMGMECEPCFLTLAPLLLMEGLAGAIL